MATVATCTRANPSVVLSPSTSASVAPGTAVSYAVSVKNNDNSGCAASSFNLAKVVPSGWSSSLSSSSLSLSPGVSGSATLTVTSATTVAAGSYSISASAVNSSAASYSGSGSASYSVASVASLSASVVTKIKAVKKSHKTFFYDWNSVRDDCLDVVCASMCFISFSLFIFLVMFP